MALGIGGIPVIHLPVMAAATLDETMAVHAPEEWHERIVALSPWCCYGPQYRRGVIYSLSRLDSAVQGGYSTLAYDWLLNAEQIAGIAHTATGSNRPT